MRRVYVQLPSGELVERGKEPPPSSISPDAGALWGDRNYRGLRASDGTLIDTRTKQREYMKRMGLTTVDDFRSHFANAREARERFYRGEDATRRADIARALEKARG